MGKVKEFYFEQLQAVQESLDAEHCLCPANVNGMDEMCPQCLAQYEEHLMANYEELEQAGLIMSEEQYEREIAEDMRKRA